MKKLFFGLTICLWCLISAAQVAQVSINTGSSINCIVRYNNTLYICGDFSHFGASTISYLAMLNAQTCALQNWNPNPNGQVTQMIIQNGQLIVCGYFDTIAGQPRNSIAIFDAATGALSPVVVPVQSYVQVTALCADGNTIYFNGQDSFVYNIQSFDLTTGTIYGWRSDYLQFVDLINSIAIYGNYLYVGGEFYGPGGDLAINNLARFNIATGATDTAFMRNSIPYSSGQNWVQQVLPYHDTLYVCGSFNTFNSNSADGFVALDTSGNQINFSLGTTTHQNFSLFPQGNTLWVGGTSQYFANNYTFYAAQMNLSTGLATCWINPLLQIAGFTYALYVTGDTVYEGTSIGFGMSVGGTDITQVSVDASSSTLASSSVSDTFTVSPAASGTYQWYVNGVASSTDSIFISSGFHNGDSIWVVFTPSPGSCNTYTLTSSVFYVSVMPNGIDPIIKSQVNLYPNPNNGLFTLQTINSINQDYTISDMLGNVVAHDDITSRNQTIQIPESAEGIYTMVVAGTEPIRFIIMR